MKLLLSFTFLLCLLLLASCKSGQSSSKPNNKEQALEVALRNLNEKAPSVDANLHFTQGNLKYVACIGEAPGPYFPNIPESEWNSIREKGNYWIIEGTSDAIESQKHLKLIDRASAYASEYNTKMMELRQKKVDK